MVDDYCNITGFKYLGPVLGKGTESGDYKANEISKRK